MSFTLIIIDNPVGIYPLSQAVIGRPSDSSTLMKSGNTILPQGYVEIGLWIGLMEHMPIIRVFQQDFVKPFCLHRSYRLTPLSAPSLNNLRSIASRSPAASACLASKHLENGQRIRDQWVASPSDRILKPGRPGRAPIDPPEPLQDSSLRHPQDWRTLGKIGSRTPNSQVVGALFQVSLLILLSPYVVVVGS